MGKGAWLAVEAGHGYHHAQRLMRNPNAGDLARGSFERLLASCKA